MKRFTISFLVIFLLCIFQSGLLHAGNPMKIYEGTWKFTAEQAPFGYQAGSIIFEIKGDTLTGYLKFADSDYVIEFQNIEINDKGMNFGITVEYEQVSMKVSVNDNVFTGTAEYSSGLINFSATRVVKGKK
jgi:hypothetical protein